MTLYLMRHFKVDCKIEKFVNSRGFDNLCYCYDHSPVKSGKPVTLAIEKIYTSTLERSQITAESITPKVEKVSTELLNEVPAKSFIDTPLILPGVLWYLISRLQWFINSQRQTEGRKETFKRINSLLEIVEKDGKDAVLVGHGYYFIQLKKVLKKRGYKGKSPRIFKNGEIARFTI